MFNLDKSIAENVTFRQVSMSAPEIEENRERVMGEIWGKMVCVIGGGGSGANFIEAVCD